jgi:kynurenine formamidase
MRTGTVLACLVALTLVGCQQPPPPEQQRPTLNIADIFEGKTGRWVDLTYAFSSETIYWPTGKPFELEEVAYGISENGYFYSMYNYSAGEHGGTHFDAPSHFADGSDTNEKVPLDKLIGPAVVVDVTDKVTPDYQIEVADLERWEQAHGWIPDGAIVLFRTGWGSRWPDRKSFLGTDETGPEAVAELHFPGISTDAVLFLARERRIDAVGIDTPSIDYGQSKMFETHQILYGANIPGFENVANLDQLPEAGSFIVALPMKIAGGSGGPLRIVAFVPNEG